MNAMDMNKIVECSNSNLLEDLWAIISKKLNTTIDVVRFRSVCRFGALFFLLHLPLTTFAFHIKIIFYSKPKYTALNHHHMITTLQLLVLIKVGSLKFFKIQIPPNFISLISSLIRESEPRKIPKNFWI